MKILSVNTGAPKTIEWNGKIFSTSIYKYPQAGSCAVSFLNIKTDQQADLKYHGGENKAIYSYDISYYNFWKNKLPQIEFPFGAFGENLTTDGLLDHKVCIGDQFKIGSVILMAVQPRIPCYKLNARFNLNNMVDLFYLEKKNGIYFKVLQEGALQAGDKIELIEKSEYQITIEDITQTLISKGEDQKLLKAILDIPFFPQLLKSNFVNLVR